MHHATGNFFHMCFVDIQKAFDKLPRKVLEWAMRKKGITKVLVISVMSSHDGAKVRVRVDSELSEEFVVNAGMHQGSVLSPFILAVEVDLSLKWPERVC